MCVNLGDKFEKNGEIWFWSGSEMVYPKPSHLYSKIEIYIHPNETLLEAI